jgi:hypothetical protein
MESWEQVWVRIWIKARSREGTAWIEHWAWRQELRVPSTKYYWEHMHKSLKAEGCRRGREGTTGLAIWLSVQWEVPTDGTGGYFPNRC